MAITVAAETPLQDDVRRLIGELNATLLALTPPEFCSHMTAEQMAQPDTTVFLAREDGVAVSCGALRRHAESTGEVKRMYTRPSHQGRGIGGRILAGDRDAGPQGRPGTPGARDRPPPSRGLARVRARRLHALRPRPRLSGLGVLRVLRQGARSREIAPAMTDFADRTLAEPLDAPGGGDRPHATRHPRLGTPSDLARQSAAVSSDVMRELSPWRSVLPPRRVEGTAFDVGGGGDFARRSRAPMGARRP